MDWQNDTVPCWYPPPSLQFSLSQSVFTHAPLTAPALAHPTKGFTLSSLHWTKRWMIVNERSLLKQSSGRGTVLLNVSKFDGVVDCRFHTTVFYLTNSKGRCCEEGPFSERYHTWMSSDRRSFQQKESEHRNDMFIQKRSYDMVYWHCGIGKCANSEKIHEVEKRIRNSE